MHNIGNTPIAIHTAATALPFPPAALSSEFPGWATANGSPAQVDILIRGSTAISLTVAELVAARLYPFVYADKTFTAANTDVCTATGHGLLTGDGPLPLSTSGALPGGLTTSAPVYAIKIDADTFKVAASREDAIKGIAIDITSTGTGTHTISDNASTQRLAWFSCATLATPIALTATKGYARRVDAPAGVFALALVGTLDTGNVTVEVSPVVEV